MLPIISGMNRADSFSFNDVFNVRGGDLAKWFLGEQPRAAARLGNLDRRQIRVRVPCYRAIIASEV